MLTKTNLYRGSTVEHEMCILKHGEDKNRETISKLADFLFNCTVASIAVSVFGDKAWGAVIGVFFLFWSYRPLPFSWR